MRKPIATALAIAAMSVAPWFASPSFSQAPDEEDVVVAVVDGKQITQSMVDQAVRTQIKVWLLGNRGKVNRDEVEREIRRIEEQELDNLVERFELLSEFKRMGGQIKDQFIDEAVSRFIDERFDGDREKFLAELREVAMTIAQFREVQRDAIAVMAIRQRRAREAGAPPVP